jgi:ParB-like chromosome segregation protein Spo0J
MTDQIISYSNLPFHPLAEKFPLMEGDDLQKLADDISARGLLHQIVLHEGKILDGRNRYRAAALAKVTLAPKDFRELPASTDPRADVISANLHRRHLTAEQKRTLLAELIKIDPTKSNRQIAEEAKVDKNTVKSVRDGLEATGEIHQLEETTGKDGKQRKTKKTGKKKPGPRPAHQVYKAKQEELIDLLKDTHGSYSQAVEWADNTKQRLNDTIAAIGKELDEETAEAEAA